MASGAPELGLRPLTARSVILSVLLGSHPPFLPVRALVRTAGLFGITEGTTRVALSRLAAEGDVLAEDSSYRLSPRLAARQKRQDEALRPTKRAWDGLWELAVCGPETRGAPERAALRSELTALRLAEMRPGVWVRPANLALDWTASLSRRVWHVEGRALSSEPDAASLVAELWDLSGWTATALALLESLDDSGEPAQRFMLAAAIVRHIREDPVLPEELLPAGWPGGRLRSAYAEYQRELTDLLRRERSRHSSRG